MKPGTAKYYLDEKGQFYVMTIIFNTNPVQTTPPYARPFTEVEVEDHEEKLDWPINTAQLHWFGEIAWAMTVIRSPDGQWTMSD
jgi:hypothetical protein